MSPEARIHGVSPVLAVPFTDEGEVDLAGFRTLVGHVMRSGARSMMLFGFAGEFYKLSDDERAGLRRAMLDELKKSDTITSIVSITTHSIELAIKHAMESVAEGADVLNVLPPYLHSPARDAVLKHLAAVLDAVDVPVIVQHAPALTGVSLNAQVFSELAGTHPNLCMVKVESTPPGRMISELLSADPPLPALVGYAGVQLPDALQRGVAGVQPGSSFPEIYVAIWRAWRSGEVGEALELHRRLLPFISYWMQDIELIIRAEKTILARRGIIASDRCRAPGWTLDRYELQMIDRFLKEFAPQLS